MKINAQQTQFLVLAAIAFFLVGGGMFSALFSYSAINASNQVSLDKTTYEYGEPIIISWNVNKDAPIWPIPQAGNYASTAIVNYFQSISLSNLYIIVDGQQINQPSLDMTMQPYEVKSGECSEIASYYDEGFYNPSSYVCLYQKFSQPMSSELVYETAKNGINAGSALPNFFNSNDIAASIKIPQNLPPGNHTISLQWKGVVGGYALNYVGSLSPLNTLGRKGTSGYAYQEIYATKTFTINAPPENTPPIVIVSTEPCGPGQLLLANGTCLIQSIPNITETNVQEVIAEQTSTPAQTISEPTQEISQAATQNPVSSLSNVAQSLTTKQYTIVPYVVAIVLIGVLIALYIRRKKR